MYRCAEKNITETEGRYEYIGMLGGTPHIKGRYGYIGVLGGTGYVLWRGGYN